MADSKVQLSGIFTLLAPLFEKQRRQELERQAEMGAKVMAGEATPQEQVLFLLKNPKIAKEFQDQMRYGEIQKLQSGLEPRQVAGSMPTQQEVAQAFIGRQGGINPNIPFPIPELPRTEYPTPEQYRNIGARISALQGKGYDVGQAPTQQAQTGAYDALAQQRLSGIGVNRARELLLGNQAGLAEAKRQVEGEKLKEVTEKTNKLLFQIDRGKQLLPYEIEKAKDTLDKLKKETIKISKQADLYNSQGRKEEANAIKQEIINNHLPKIQKLEIGLKSANIGLVNAKTEHERAKTSNVGRAGTADKLKLQQEKAQYPKLRKDDIEKTIPALIQLFSGGVATRKKWGIFNNPIERPATREQAERFIETETGLHPDRPEIKRILDRYYPIQQPTQPQQKGNQQDWKKWLQ